MDEHSARPLFLILSVERTRSSKELFGRPVCVFWRPDAAGYTSNLAEAGRYTAEGIAQHADPPHHLAIPLSAIEIPASQLAALSKKAARVSAARIIEGGKQ